MEILHEKKDCIIKWLKWEEVKPFLNLYHKQKSGKPTPYNLGVFRKSDNELIGVSTFGKTRYKGTKYSADWEWYRLCYKNEITVKGGTERLLKTFIQSYNGDIISYQFESFEGTMFEGLGFKLIGKSKSKLYRNPITGNMTRHRFINNKSDKKLQEYLKANPENTVNQYFGYTEVINDMICYTWYRAKKPIGYIYRIISPENREYVGQKRSETFVENYWSSSTNSEYWKDLNKFGKENFKREIIEWCYTQDELNVREEYWIENSNALITKGGYNLAKSFRNIVYTPEVSEKLAKARKDYWSKECNHAKHGLAVKNSEKYRDSRKTVGKTISESIKSLSDEEKRKKYAFTKTVEYREKCSKTKLNRHWFNDEKTNVFTYECPTGFVPGMLETARKGKEFSLEHKLNLSKAKSNKHWYTDGIHNIYSFDCPSGWKSGRTLTREVPKCWWNDGKVNKQFIEDPGPGWTKGKIGAFDLPMSDAELLELYNNNTIYGLAKTFNVTISKMKSLLKRRNIIR